MNRYTLIKDNDKQFIILKSLAESVPYCGKLMNPEAVVGQVYQALLVSIQCFFKESATVFCWVLSYLFIQELKISIISHFEFLLKF